jgi:hypothetical protein
VHDRDGKFRFPPGVASRYVGRNARLLPGENPEQTKSLDTCKAGALPLIRRSGTLRRAESVEAVSKALFRHCERSEAIHKTLLMDWIASVFDLAMTVKRAFDTPFTKCNEY